MGSERGRERGERSLRNTAAASTMLRRLVRWLGDGVGLTDGAVECCSLGRAAAFRNSCRQQQQRRVAVASN